MKTKLIFIGATIVWLATACKPEHHQNEVRSTAKPVKVEKIQLSREPIPIEVSGLLSSKAEARLSFKIGGIVQRIYVDEGQLVKKGQLLATLDLSEINARVLQAQNATDKAHRDLNRIENLYRDSVATLEQLQDLKTVLEVSQADLKVASFNQRYARIIAPNDGKVLKRFVEQGEVVATGTPILILGSYGQDAYIMRVSLADRDIVKLALNDSALIGFDAYPGKVFNAYVSEIAEGADPATGTFEIELRVDPGASLLKSGFVGKSMIFPSSQEPYYKLSMNAIIEAEKEIAKVFLFDEASQNVRLVEFRPQYIGDTYFTVSSSEKVDLNYIITDGGPYLSDGDLVKPYNLQP